MTRLADPLAAEPPRASVAALERLTFGGFAGPQIAGPNIWAHRLAPLLADMSGNDFDRLAAYCDHLEAVASVEIARRRRDLAPHPAPGGAE